MGTQFFKELYLRERREVGLDMNTLKTKAVTNGKLEPISQLNMNNNSIE